MEVNRQQASLMQLFLSEVTTNNAREKLGSHHVAGLDAIVAEMVAADLTVVATDPLLRHD